MSYVDQSQTIMSLPLMPSLCKSSCLSPWAGGREVDDVTVLDVRKKVLQIKIPGLFIHE